jgi:peptide/nickel transport system permease protein
MQRFILRRLLAAVPVMLGITILVFSMLQLIPGDPVATILGPDSAARAEDIQAIRDRLGLNDPLPVQYGRFLFKAVQGDLGRSIRTNRPVLQMILEQFPATVELMTAAIIMAVSVGMLFGVAAAVKQNSVLDNVSMLFATVGVSIPGFWLGLMLMFIFAVSLRWLPATGTGGLDRLIMPATVLGLSHAAIIARLVRSSMVEVLRQEYVSTARAKGLSERAVLIGHALKNALIPVVTMLGLQVGGLLGGAVITEQVFARQGLGTLAVYGIIQKDFPVAQGTVLFAATVYVLVNLLVDVSYAVIDPRIRYS